MCDPEEVCALSVWGKRKIPALMPVWTGLGRSLQCPHHRAGCSPVRSITVTRHLEWETATLLQSNCLCSSLYRYLGSGQQSLFVQIVQTPPANLIDLILLLFSALMEKLRSLHQYQHTNQRGFCTHSYNYLCPKVVQMKRPLPVQTWYHVFHCT